MSNLNLQTDTVCPNCQKSIPDGAWFCPNCGYRRQRVDTADSAITRKPPPFKWWLVLTLIVFTPLATIGGCMILGIDLNDNRASNVGPPVMLSMGIGVLMFLVNVVVRNWGPK